MISLSSNAAFQSFDKLSGEAGLKDKLIRREQMVILPHYGTVRGVHYKQQIIFAVPIGTHLTDGQ